MKLTTLIGRLFLVLALMAAPLSGAFAMGADDVATMKHAIAAAHGDECHHTHVASDAGTSPGGHVHHMPHCGTTGHCCAAVTFSSSLWTGEMRQGQLNVGPEFALQPVILPLETKPPRVL